MKDTVMVPMPEPLWLRSRWEKDSRYYELRVQQDLFGDWLLTRIWGQRGSALGQLRHDLCADRAEALARYAEAEVRREKRGYRLRRPVGACSVGIGQTGGRPVITLRMELDEDIKGEPEQQPARHTVDHQPAPGNRPEAGAGKRQRQ